MNIIEEIISITTRKTDDVDHDQFSLEARCEPALYYILQVKKLEPDLIQYILDEDIYISHQEYSKLEAANFKLKNYQLLKNAKDYFKERIFVYQNFYKIERSLYVPSFDLIPSFQLHFLYDNIIITDLLYGLIVKEAVVLMLSNGLIHRQANPYLLKYFDVKLEREYFKLAKLETDLVSWQAKLVKSKGHVDNEKSCTILKKQIHGLKVKSQRKQKFINKIIEYQVLFQKLSKADAIKFTDKECAEVLGISVQDCLNLKRRTAHYFLNSIKTQTFGNYDAVFAHEFTDNELLEYFYIHRLILKNSDYLVESNKKFISKGKNSKLAFFQTADEGLLELGQLMFRKTHRQINQQWIRLTRKKLLENFLEKQNYEPIETSRFVEKFNCFLEMSSREKINRTINEQQIIVMIGSCGHFASMTYVRRLKKINEKKFITFIKPILEQQEKFFSTKIIFRKYRKELLKFDLRNETELHFYLKKVLKNEKTTMVFCRSPHIYNGQELEELLEEHLKTSTEEIKNKFLETFEAKTGVLAETIRGGFGEILNRYYVNGIRNK
ncbi:MAG: hypothetical protein ACRCUP_05195 [Mycoplasmatales bacterium]